MGLFKIKFIPKQLNSKSIIFQIIRVKQVELTPLQMDQSVITLTGENKKER